MAYKAILRVAPLTAAGIGGSSKHVAREFFEPHIDQSRTKDNMVFVGSGRPEDDFYAFIARHPGIEIPKGTVAAEIFVSVAHEYFEENAGEAGQWIKENIRMFKEKYGDRLISLTLHLDEQTPHFHAFVVPLDTYTIKTAAGKAEKTVTRISYTREFSDTKSKLAEARKSGDTDITKLGALQTWYASELQKAGLDIERGRRGSRATHLSVAEYQQIVASIGKPQNYPRPDTVAVMPEEFKKLGIASGFVDLETAKKAAIESARQGLIEGAKINKEMRTKAAAAEIFERENRALKREVADWQRRLDEKKIELEEAQKVAESAKKIMQDVSKKEREMDDRQRELDALMRGLPANEVMKGLGYEFDVASDAFITERGPVRVTGGKIEIEGWKERQPRNAVDLVMAVRGVDFGGAMGILKEHLGETAARGIAAQAVEKAQAPNPVPAPEEANWRSVRQYLVGKRGLDPALVDDLHRQKKVYADANWNAVFLHKDGAGCELRGTLPRLPGQTKDFKRARGEKTLFVLPAKGKPKAVVYVESAIEAMSYRTAFGDDYTVVSIGGENKARMLEHAKAAYKAGVPAIAAFNNDKHGNKYLADLNDVTTVARHAPPTPANDWNDALKALMIAGVPTPALDACRPPEPQKGGFAALENGPRR